MISSDGLHFEQFYSQCPNSFLDAVVQFFAKAAAGRSIYDKAGLKLRSWLLAFERATFNPVKRRVPKESPENLD